MSTYELISADLAARLGLKRLTLGFLAASLAANCLLGAVLLFKEDSVSTVLIPVGMNEVTHPVTVSEKHIDQEYLMLVARDLLSLAVNNTPNNVDFNRETLLKHVSPSSFGEIEETLREQAQQIKRLHASTYFSVETMHVNPSSLTVTAEGLKQHFIGKTETLRQKKAFTMRFSLVAGKLQLISLAEEDIKTKKQSSRDAQ